MKGEPHIHICKSCLRERKCDKLLCSHECFKTDICNDCAGQRLIDHNAASFAMLNAMGKGENK